MFRSALLKLTAVYVMLAMALSLVFTLICYRLATNELREGLRHQYEQIVSNDHDADNHVDHDDVSVAVLRERAVYIRNDMLYVNVAVLAGSVVAGYALARRTLRPIEEAHQNQIRFTAEVSHELKTPLTAMKADTESILMQPDSSATELRETLADNLRDIERLERLTRHLLGMGRYRSGVGRQAERINLNLIITNVLHQLQISYGAKRISVVRDITVNDVQGNPASVEQLLMILIDNAFKYSPESGSIQVGVHTEQHKVVMTITDEGIGIDKADLPHIFEHFYRSSHSSASKAASGYGLGLPLAKDIVTTYRGTITVDSELGHDTTVTVRLPLKIYPKKSEA